MRLISKELKFNPDTFAPELFLTVSVEMELLHNGAVLLGDDELALIVGREFVNMWKDHKSLTEDKAMRKET